MPTRILVTGSRVWTNAAMMQAAIAGAIADLPGPVTLVHGAATGADQLAAALAPTLGPHVTCESWPANWSVCRSKCHPGHRRVRTNGMSHCPAAGAYRNQDMVNAGADLCLAFPMNESTGTRDCMRRAETAGIPVIDVPATVCAPLFGTERHTKRRAWDIASRAGAKPQPAEYHDDCGGWHLAADRTDDTTTRGA